MKLLRIGLAMAIVLTAVSCSHQWREGDDTVTEDRMNTVLDEMNTSATTQSTGSSGPYVQALALKDDPNSRLFYAEGPGPMGSVANIVSFSDFTFLGDTNGSLGFTSIAEARVLFIDTPGPSDRKASLVIGLKLNGQDAFTYSAFTGTAAVDSGTYSATLAGGVGGNTQITLQSDDLSGDELGSTVQMRIYDRNGTNIGKVPTLEGFRQ